MPGPGNCTVTPIPPSSLSSPGGHSAAGKGSTMASSAPSASTNTTLTVSASVSSEHSSVGTPVSTEPSVSGAAGMSTSEPSLILTNEQLENSLRRDCDALAAHLKEVEEQQVRNNIYVLHEKKAALQERIKQIESNIAGAQAPPSGFQVPPCTASTWSQPNPFAPPNTSSGISASAFGSSALGNTTTAAGLVFSNQPQPRSVTSIGNPLASGSFTNPIGLPPSSLGPTPLLASQSTSMSMPNLHATIGHPPQASTARGPLFSVQSFPNLPEVTAQATNMAALNPNEFPFLSSDQVFDSNPLVKAILGMHGETKEEAARLGKYIPELFALKHGPIQEIRSRMSYSEFIAMYTRMLMYMLRDDPHLVPDRLVFLYNVAKKAAKFRWPDVRECYGVAIQEIKINRRKWADHWGEITENLEKVQSSNPRYGPPRPASSCPPGIRLVSPLDSSRPLCADYNDRSCTRQVCKFYHECAKCGGGHPRQQCYMPGDKDSRPYHPSNPFNPPSQST